MRLSKQTVAVLLLGVGLAGAALAFIAMFFSWVGSDMPIHADAAIQVRQGPADASLGQAYNAVIGDQELYGILIQQMGDALL